MRHVPDTMLKLASFVIHSNLSQFHLRCRSSLPITSLLAGLKQALVRSSPYILFTSTSQDIISWNSSRYYDYDAESSHNSQQWKM
jgi:hypothetical protein